jgi:glyoxylase-like metal-dependent hydrolase (beta-lactamase superfamily II)
MHAPVLKNCTNSGDGNQMSELFILRIVPEGGDDSNAIHPAVVRDDNCLALFDCGYLGSLPMIEAAMSEHRLSCLQLTHVILTHHDHDHVGALAALKRKYPQVQIVSGREEAAFIRGTKPALRLTQARAMQPSLEGDAAAFGLKFIKMLEQLEPVDVDITVEDGDILPICGGVEALATPGHTAGHTAYDLRALDVLIAGDAAVLEDGALMLAYPQYAEDLSQAEQSFQRILAHPARTIICYHGGIFRR